MICYSHIEAVVCDCVNDVFSQMLNTQDTIVTPDMLYDGVTKVPVAVCVARQFCYYAMHDMYHVAYSTIAMHSGNSTRGVINGVRKVRELTGFDTIYSGVMSLIEEKM